jgi:general secretion pathway protein K
MNRRERGVAAITAILIVAVAASAATLMLAQQSAMVDQAMLITSRAQADLYARAGIDWARGVLQEDSRTSRQVDSLGEAWAQPIAALPVERALVSGAITDEQGKFNLNNLVRDSQRDAEAFAAFQRLLASRGLPTELADAVVDWIDEDADLSGPGGAEDAYYLSLRKPYRAANAPMAQIEELYRVRGFDAAAVAKLRPYVTALPGTTTPVNVNTASDVVIKAMLNASDAAIAKFLAERVKTPIANQPDIKQRLQLAAAPAETLANIRSDFFSVRVQVAQDDVELASEALVQRAATTGAPSIVWLRPRY